jgi:hypothetical protein
MTGPEHYVEAERLLALADRHTKGVTYEQKWTLTPIFTQRIGPQCGQSYW